ncbi:MAG: hypothetical protein Q9171_007143 [Xanthocarpia ochracea]
MYTLLYFLSLFFTILLSIQSIVAAPAPPVSTLERRASWPEWADFEKLFVFGASYTCTWFDSGSSEQPTLSEPLGNARLRPNKPGPVDANGPNFVTYLTTTFNASKLLTYNFAYPGASVDESVVNKKKAITGGNDLVKQVKQNFLPGYTRDNKGHHPPKAEWHSSSTLFLFFFGINDNLALWQKSNATALTAAIFESYFEKLSTLYTHGARHFLLLNTPPMEIMPRWTGHGTHEGAPYTDVKRHQIKSQVDNWNSHFPRLVARFHATHPDANIRTFDLHALFLEMQVSLAATNALTAQYASHRIENLTASCGAYGPAGDAKLPSADWFNRKCGVSYPAYFWMNPLHPTWSVHKVVAGRIAGVLEGLS